MIQFITKLGLAAFTAYVTSGLAGGLYVLGAVMSVGFMFDALVGLENWRKSEPTKPKTTYRTSSRASGSRFDASV